MTLEHADPAKGPNDATVPAMVWARIASHSGETILRKKDHGIWKPISWAELGARARAVGSALRADGLAPGQVAGILSEATPDWIAADLGILAVGGVSVGIYPTDGSPAVAQTLQHSGCSVLFVENEEQLDKVLDIRNGCPNLRRIIVMNTKGLRDFSDPMCESIDGLVARGRAVDQKDPEAWQRGIDAIAPSDLAVLAYTSGTTGRARGVMLSHGNIMAQVTGTARLTGQTAADERLAFLPICHVTERILGLYQSLYCRSISSLVENAETVPENLREVRPTVLIAIPRVWQKFYSGIAVASAGAAWLQKTLYEWAFRLSATCVEAELAGHTSRGMLTKLADRLVLRRARRAVGLDRLRVAWVGGAPVSPALLRWYRTFGVDLREVYGLTECGGLAATAPDGRLCLGSVGAAVAHGEVGISPEGEVLVRGAHVCFGYWNDPLGTAAALESGWLRTGDLSRLEEGLLTLTGRRSNLLALPDGAQISPAMLENELALSPYIADALVLRHGRGLCALVMIEIEAVERWAQDNNVPYTGFVSLVRTREVSELIGSAIEKANAQAPAIRRINSYRVIDQNLAPGDPELTPMMKLRRELVIERFRPMIEEMSCAA